MNVEFYFIEKYFFTIYLKVFLYSDKLIDSFRNICNNFCRQDSSSLVIKKSIIYL